jgi:hypothetical protein
MISHPLHLMKEMREIFNRIKDNSYHTLLQFIVYLLNRELTVLPIKLYFIEIAAKKSYIAHLFLFDFDLVILNFQFQQ